MAGYWPSSFLCVFMDRDEEQLGQYPAILTKQAWSIKDLLYWFCLCGNKASDLEWTRQAHLACLGSQSEHRIRFILPARRPSLKNYNKVQYNMVYYFFPKGFCRTNLHHELN